MALGVGQLIGNYSVVRLLGEGGFGEVYLVENPLIFRLAAVKVLHPALAQDAELVRRFLNEARAASAIRHPSIVDVLDAGGTAEGAPYILMEFLEGESLHKRLATHGRLALAQVLEIANQAGSALTAAHAAGIVHRDLKPENLFLVPDASAPGGERVKVLDFGIAKIMHGSGSGATLRTRTGIIMGSPAYMSPEQCKDSADVDLRSDIYSFAIILYEMLSGSPPHVAASGTELLIKHLTETPRPLRDVVADLPAHVDVAILRALALARDDRFASVPSFLAALAGAGAGEASVHTKPEQKFPAGRKIPAPGPVRTALLPARTTFSRATGEIAATDDEEDPAEGPRPRRWLPLAIAGTAAAGLALAVLFLAKPGSRVTMPATPVPEPTHPIPPAPPAPPVPPTDKPAMAKAPLPTAAAATPEAKATLIADSNAPAAVPPAGGDGNPTKRTGKERSRSRVAKVEAHGSASKPPQTVAPAAVLPPAINSATAPTAIKRQKF